MLVALAYGTFIVGTWGFGFAMAGMVKGGPAGRLRVLAILGCVVQGVGLVLMARTWGANWAMAGVTAAAVLVIEVVSARFAVNMAGG